MQVDLRLLSHALQHPFVAWFSGLQFHVLCSTCFLKCLNDACFELLLALGAVNCGDERRIEPLSLELIVHKISLIGIDTNNHYFVYRNSFLEKKSHEIYKISNFYKAGTDVFGLL